MSGGHQFRGDAHLRLVDPVPSFLEHLGRSSVVEGLRLCVDLFSHAAFRDIVEERIAPSDEILASDEALDHWIKREVMTAQHISSTCKMGPPSDPLAVVDQFGKVYGVEGLRVVDASIMPDTVRANLNVTVLAMAEHVADFIKEGR